MRASFDRSPGSIWSSGSWFPPPDVGVARCFWCFWCFWCFLASGSNAMLPGRLFRCCCVCRDFSPACSSGCVRGAAPEVALVPSRLNPKAASESVGVASVSVALYGYRGDDGTKRRRDEDTTGRRDEDTTGRRPEDIRLKSVMVIMEDGLDRGRGGRHAPSSTASSSVSVRSTIQARGCDDDDIVHVILGIREGTRDAFKPPRFLPTDNPYPRHLHPTCISIRTIHLWCIPGVCVRDLRAFACSNTRIPRSGTFVCSGRAQRAG